MTEEELKNKCKERAKIFQQAMESCKSSSPMDCIEWFADRIVELEKENAELKEQNRNYEQLIDNGSVTLAKERLKNYKQLTKATEIIKELLDTQSRLDPYRDIFKDRILKAEQFLKELEK